MYCSSAGSFEPLAKPLVQNTAIIVFMRLLANNEATIYQWSWYGGFIQAADIWYYS